MSSIAIPLDHDAHHYAQIFAQQQATPGKGKQVYLNTLAVCAVHNYLKWLSVPTRLDQGDSWHSGIRAILDVADLVIPKLGKLECRPVISGATALKIPNEVNQDRIGYVVVEIEESLNNGHLLGFLPCQNPDIPPEPVPLSRLQSLDSLIDRLHTGENCINLSQWFEGFSLAPWQPLYSVRGVTVADEVSEDSRSQSRAQILQWNQEGWEKSILLVVEVTETDTGVVDLHLQVYPSNQDPFLPEGLEVKVLDDEGISCMEAQAGVASSGLQLKFEGSPQERFSINLTSGELNFTERFKL
jgi:hypothetical protein